MHGTLLHALGPPSKAFAARNERRRRDRRRRLARAGAIALAAWANWGAAGKSWANDPPLAQQARALLSDRCFACHGPDSGKREADLRLDRGDSFIGEDGLVVPGDPAASELVRRVQSTDEWEQMPPPESHLALSDEEVALLTKWVDAGAPWAEHWSFVPPTAPPLPQSNGWGENEIDRFIARDHQKSGLSPNAPADRALLLRRVTLDLTGLPPTLAELDRYLADKTPHAYERAIDRLLASPRFGERMAVDWLDTARYADTYGYQNDRFRRVWPWRDWVVRAINENLPYDEFLTWQLAGDLLPEPTEEQRLATAFNRLHRETNEGGSLPTEFRAENVADRVNTVGSATLGLTLECCRCHDHKFDPISQRDYYAFFAYFNNTGELGLYAHYTDAVPTPALDLPDASQRNRLALLEQRVATIEAERAQLEPSAHSLATLPSPPAPTGSYSFDQLGEEEELVGTPQQIEGVSGKALRLDGENGWTGPVHAFERSDPFSIALWVRPTEAGQDAVIVHRSRAWLDAAGRGYQLTLDEGRPSVALVHFWPGDALARRSHAPLPAGEWTHLAFTYDGSSEASGLRLYVNGAPAETDVLHDKLSRTIRYAEGDLMPDDAVRLTIGHRFRDTGFKGGAVDDLAVYATELTPPEVRSLAGGQMERVTPNEWAEHQLRRHSDQYSEATDRLHAARAERDALRDEVPQIAVMAEQPRRRPTHVLLRGAYDAPGDVVEPAPPEAIGSEVPAGEPDRLGLARWITSPDNPLTARVAVNRLWQSVFGRGLVATPNDFGSQGAAPTHPELLDWLAVRFVESGWDVKAMVRLMVTSATYRQSSLTSPNAYRADPDNERLARGPSGRLSAEALRDTALATGGLLVEQLGGPPVHPFQPPGLWEEKGAATYRRDPGPGSHRRSLYTVWKRTSPPPSMMTFDAADREVCVMRRQATATPLQALVLLNDPQVVEAACGLADRAMEEAQPEAQPEAQLIRLFRLATSRFPTAAELAVLGRLRDEQLEYFQSDPRQAVAMVGVGDRAAIDAETAPETAAMASVALAVLNHDAFVTKR